MKIPLYSPTICRSEMEAVLERMVEERVGPGDVNAGFSKAICTNFPSSGALSLRSPSIALGYALELLALTEGSSVVLSALSPSWMLTELERRSLKPIIIDTSPNSIFMDIEKVKTVATGASAIILDEPLGFIPDMKELISLNLPIIEDISKSIGAEREGVIAGVSGDVAILGLEETDAITAGGGAALIANNKDCKEALKQRMTQVSSIELMPDINASLATIQLKQNKKNIETKKDFLAIYQKALLQTKHRTIQIGEHDINPIYCFPIIFESNVAEIEKFVEKKEIEIERAFKNSILSSNESLQESYINASSMLFRTFLFPLYPLLGLKKAMEIAKIISVLP